MNKLPEEIEKKIEAEADKNWPENLFHTDGHIEALVNLINTTSREQFKHGARFALSLLPSEIYIMVPIEKEMPPEESEADIVVQVEDEDGKWLDVHEGGTNFRKFYEHRNVMAWLKKITLSEDIANQKSDAAEFIEWATSEGFYRLRPGRWIGRDNNILTTEELYNLFKSKSIPLQKSSDEQTF